MPEGPVCGSLIQALGYVARIRWHPEGGTRRIEDEIIDRRDRIMEARARPLREHVDIEGAARLLGVSRQTLSV